MTKHKQFDWAAYRKDVEADDPPELNSGHVLALLDSRDSAIRTLTQIVSFCPQRPQKPFAKRILQMAKDGLKEARNGDSEGKRVKQ